MPAEQDKMPAEQGKMPAEQDKMLEQKGLMLEKRQKESYRKTKPLLFMLICVVIALLVITLVVGLIILVIEQAVRPPFVDLECGRVEGIYDVTNDVFLFRGIPYASPPTGNLRWRRTVPLTPELCWLGTLKATSSNKCPQLKDGKLTGEEDCLKLDIAAPSQYVRESLLPVVLTIHGGGLVVGSSSNSGLTPDAQVVRNTQAVFVNMNYRLGLFGFLAAKELGEDQSGNYGIWDQLEALKWTKNNIEKFGGDPNKITLMGISSGASSATILVASARAQGLFQRAWITGGSPRMGATLNDVVNCSSSPYYKQMESTGCKNATCLRDLPMEQFFSNYKFEYEYTKELFIPKKLDYTFRASLLIDGDLIRSDYEDVWQNKVANYSDVPLLIGSNAQERNCWTEKNVTEADLNKYLQESLQDFGVNLTNEALATYNLSTQDDPDHVVTSLSSDIYVTCGYNRLALLIAESQANLVYRYVATYPPSSPPMYCRGGHANAFHVWDAFSFYAGQNVILSHPPQKSDLDFQNTMTTFVKEFIHQGKISGWKGFPKATALVGSAHVTHLDSDYHKKQCEFWNSNGLSGYDWAE